jgi:hypothetical protein
LAKTQFPGGMILGGMDVKKHTVKTVLGKKILENDQKPG